MNTKIRSTRDMLASVSPEMEALRLELKETQSLLQASKVSSGQIEGIMGEVLAAVKKQPLVAVPRPAGTAGRGKPITLVVQAADWHIGLVTPRDMIEEFNEFNWDIAQARIANLVQAVSKYTTTMRAGYTVDKLVIIGTGDWVSGDIHDGLIRTNEFPAPVQSVRAGRLFAGMVSAFAGIFPSVRVEFIAPGNHDRLTKKPQAQAGGLNSFGYIVGAIAQDSMREQKNVDFRLHTAMQTIVDVEGRRYLCGHGDGIIGTWGIPFYGIERKKMREATARQNMPEAKRFHRIVIGHFHTGLDHEDWLIGGSLSGTDENDHKCGRHSKPHQTSWCVHPTHGEFGFTRWYL